MKKKFTSIRRGAVEIRKFGHQWHGWLDPYHLLLTLSWPRFFALLTGFFLAVNLLFATAYWLVPGSVSHAQPGSFLDMLFFSIETIATVGYGEMVPGTLAGHLISSLEILAGLLSLAVVTGLVFARFSKPTARVLFSSKIVTRDFDGHRVLMLRVANERHNQMLEPTANLGLVRLEKAAEGETYFRIHDLALKGDRNPTFALTWTLVHWIDESSPLYGWTKAALEAAHSRITVSIFGHDETIAASVYALHEYSAEQIYFDHQFVDIISEGENGMRIIDMTHFHDVVPTASSAARTGS
jgi:inward rectifier potassium channel